MSAYQPTASGPGLPSTSRQPAAGRTYCMCPVGPGRLTCHVIRVGTTASADPRGIFHQPIIGPGPRARSSAIDPPGAVTLRGSGPEQRIGARRTQKRTTAASLPADQAEHWARHAMILQAVCERSLSRVWGFGPARERRCGGSREPRYSWSVWTVQPLQGGIKRTAIQADRPRLRSWVVGPAHSIIVWSVPHSIIAWSVPECVWSVPSLRFESTADQPSGAGAHCAGSSHCLPAAVKPEATMRGP
jgi:hypothetical protein